MAETRGWTRRCAAFNAMMEAAAPRSRRFACQPFDEPRALTER